MLTINQMYKDRESLTDSFWRNIGVRIDTVKEWSEAELDFRLKKALDDLKLTEIQELEVLHGLEISEERRSN